MRLIRKGLSLAAMVAGLCVSPAVAGAQDSPSTSGTAGATQPAAPVKPKKIWTNDDVAAASGSNSPAAKQKNDNSAGSDANAKLAKQLRDRLDKLESQLKDTEKQLADLKNFEAGEVSGSGGRQLHKGYSMEPVPDQIAKLEAKRRQLQEQIDEVYDEARKRGILPGQLRS